MAVDDIIRISGNLSKTKSNLRKIEFIFETQNIFNEDGFYKEQNELKRSLFRFKRNFTFSVNSDSAVQIVPLCVEKNFTLNREESFFYFKRHPYSLKIIYR